MSREREGSLGCAYHDTGIVGQDVQSLLLAQKLIDAAFNAWQVGEIQLQELQLALGVGCVRFDICEPLVGFCLRAASDVDSAVGCVQEFTQFLAHARVATCYYEDAAGLVWEVLFREGGGGDEEALAEGVEVEGHDCVVGWSCDVVILDGCGFCWIVVMVVVGRKGRGVVETRGSLILIREEKVLPASRQQSLLCCKENLEYEHGDKDDIFYSGGIGAYTVQSRRVVMR